MLHIGTFFGNTVTNIMEGNEDQLAVRRFAEDPEFAAARFERPVAAGAHLVGFCCGSTPGHIAAVAQQRKSIFGF